MNFEPLLSEHAVIALKEAWVTESFGHREECLTEFDKANKRLEYIFSLMGESAPFGKKIQGSNIVVLGGGPGEMITWHPWLPRAAALAGANYVINYDIGYPSDADRAVKLYEHDYHNGDVLYLLNDESNLFYQVEDKYLGKVDLIEVSNLLGNNASPTLENMLLKNGKVDKPTGQLSGDHRELVRLRMNLRANASRILTNGGILAIDKSYYRNEKGRIVFLKDHSDPVSHFIEDES